MERSEINNIIVRYCIKWNIVSHDPHTYNHFKNKKISFKKLFNILNYLICAERIVIYHHNLQRRVALLNKVKPRKRDFVHSHSFIHSQAIKDYI